jgi:hypothetical protein
MHACMRACVRACAARVACERACVRAGTLSPAASLPKRKHAAGSSHVRILTERENRAHKERESAHTHTASRRERARTHERMSESERASEREGGQEGGRDGERARARAREREHLLISVVAHVAHAL